MNMQMSLEDLGLQGSYTELRICPPVTKSCNQICGHLERMMTAKLGDARPGILKHRTPEDGKNNPEDRKNSTSYPTVHLLIAQAHLIR